MMSIRKMLLMLLMTAALAGCGMVEELGRMQDKMQTVNAELQRELGTSAQVGWNIHNGTLTQVTVYISGDALEHRTLGELKEAVVPLLEKHFEQAPTKWLITVAYEGGPG